MRVGILFANVPHLLVNDNAWETINRVDLNLATLLVLIVKTVNIGPECELRHGSNVPICVNIIILAAVRD